MGGAAALAGDPLEAAFQAGEGQLVRGNYLKGLAMKLASQIFSEQERKRIDDAVAEAEKKPHQKLYPSCPPHPADTTGQKILWACF